MRARHLTWILALFIAGIFGWQATEPPEQTRFPLMEHGRQHHSSAPALPLGRGRSPDSEGQIAELEALAQGHPVILTDDAGMKTTLLFQPSPLLTSGFGVSLGPSGQNHWQEAHALSGWAFSKASATPSPAHLAAIGNQVTGTWENSDGTQTRWQWTLGSSEVSLFEMRHPSSRSHLCELDGKRACVQSRLHDGEREVTSTRRGKIALKTAAQGGLEPATGEATRYVDPFPLPEAYALSLKDMNVLLVLDKSATGMNETAHLQQVASRWLATMANVATIYENQLGIRLRLQELIIIPDDPEFNDVPFDKVLPDFNRWVSRHRPRNVYHWHSAFKAGRGLNSSDLGLAYVASLGRSDSIGVLASDAGWTTLAHEMGHSLGANHTLGGMMNAQANGGGNRDFFTQVNGSPGISAAREIFDHSKNLLSGEADLRHPEEIPFAKNDFRTGAGGETIRFDPTSNDLAAVNFGRVNHALNVDAVTNIRPANAGTVNHDGRQLVFQPAPEFRGPVWFSYALRGSLGNDGRGWLHKGDVTLFIGEEPPQLNLTFSPGETRTLFIQTSPGTLTQPRDALLHTLPDDPEHLLIRVHEWAQGTDSFIAGTREYHLTYRASTLQTRPDVYWHHYELGTLRMRPLANDEATSPGGTAAGTALSLGPEEARLDSFPRALHLIDAENLSPDKGTLEVVPVDPANPDELSGELRFHPNPGAGGTATLQYTALDPNGDVMSETITIYLLGSSEKLIPTDAVTRYHIPLTPANASLWMLRSFDDRSWPPGALPVGYEHGRGYEALIATDIGRQMVNVNSSVYLRIPFEVTRPETITHLMLHMRIDDGFVAYLNSHEIWRENAPADIQWNSAALEGREAEDFVVIDLSEARSILQSGENLLAIQGLNSLIDSSDFLVMPELVALRLPSLATITSPAAASVSVPTGTGIRFHRENNGQDAALPITGPVETSWQITETGSDALVPSLRDVTGAFDVFFDRPGTYRIRLTARDASGAETTDQRVIHVGAFKPYDQLGDSVDAGPDFELTDYSAFLSASVDRVVPGQKSVTLWQKVSGPGQVFFEDAVANATEATFTQPGHYHLRYVSSRPEFTVFDDVLLNVLTETRTLVGESTESNYQYFTEATLPSAWTSPDYPPATWMTGGQGLGYDLTNAFFPYINTNLQETMQFRHSSVYIRYPFVLENVRSVYQLTLRLRVDDGCVVYLNGQEVHRQHAPFFALGPASSATRSVDESGLEIPSEINLTEFKTYLRPGYNVLAIHGLNHSTTSSDFLIQPGLTAGMGITGPVPDDLGGQNLLAFALGKGERPLIEVEDGKFRITFLQNNGLETHGGRIDVETSTDLRHWSRWAHETETRTPFNEEHDKVTRLGPRQGTQSFVRLRVSF